MSSAGAVVLELDRHSRRSGLGKPPARTAESSDPQKTSRPNISPLVETVARAGASILDMMREIKRLEGSTRELEQALDQMRKDYSETSRQHRAVEAKAKLETERAQRAEAKIALLQAREERLVADLDDARSERDLLAEAITDFLCQEGQVVTRSRTSGKKHDLSHPDASSPDRTESAAPPYPGERPALDSPARPDRDTAHGQAAHQRRDRQGEGGGERRRRKGDA